MIRKPWRNWYHCMVGTYGQWLPGDPRGWRERNHHEHVPGDYKHPPKPTAFSKARHEYSKRIMNWTAYAIAPEDRPTIGRLLLQSFREHNVPILALAVCETNVHALLQIVTHDPKRILGFAKRHATFEFAPIIDPATNKREQIWEGGAFGKPVRDRPHAIKVFNYIMNHIKEGAWVWSYRDTQARERHSARAVADGGRGPSTSLEI